MFLYNSETCMSVVVKENNFHMHLAGKLSHGHDNISIRMLKICGVSICKPLEIIFRTCLNHGQFPEE